MKSVVFLTFLISSCWIAVDAKTFLSCELAQIFSKNNFERSLIPHWVCLVQAESQGNSSKITTLPNKSTNYGIFQINSKDWCKEDKKGGICNIKCSDLTDDDLTDDINCAKTIFARDGFKAWRGWEHKCKSTSTSQTNNALPNLVNCNYR